MNNNSEILFLEIIQDIRKYDVLDFLGGNPDQKITFWQTYNEKLNINENEKYNYEKKLLYILKNLFIKKYISDNLDKSNGQNLWTGICITNKGLKYFEEEKKKKLWVKYKNYNGNYQKESKNPTQIYAYKFNEKFFKKLFLKNLLQDISDYMLNLKLKKGLIILFNIIVIIGVIYQVLSYYKK